MNAQHETYIVPGVVDGAVARQQAERRRDHREEVTILHDHPYVTLERDSATGRFIPNSNAKAVPCNERCTIYQPGLQTITYFDYKQGAVAPSLDKEN